MHWTCSAPSARVPTRRTTAASASRGRTHPMQTRAATSSPPTVPWMASYRGLRTRISRASPPSASWPGGEPFCLLVRNRSRASYPHHPPGPQRSIQGAHRACRPGYGSLRRSGQLGCNRRSLHGCHHDRHSSRSTGHASRHPAAWTGPNITSATVELWKAYIAKHNVLRSRMELSLNVSAFPSVAEPPPAARMTATSGRGGRQQ